MEARELRTGQICYCRDCPDLGGERSKDRPVLIISPAQHLAKSPREVLVVAISTSTTDPGRIRMPNREENPQTTSGLARVCWAVPRWYLMVDIAKLDPPIGYILKVKLAEVVEAVRRHVAEAAEERKRKG